MADKWYHSYYRGVLLPKIAYALSSGHGDQKKYVGMLHKAFKEYFCIGSTADLSNHHFLLYLSAIIMIMAREKGLLVPFINEPNNCDEMSMVDWLNLQRIIDKN